MGGPDRTARDPALLPDLANWIGRHTVRHDVVSARLDAGFRTALAPHLAAGPGVPPGLFWCLAPDMVEHHDLGRDGHPRTGLLLPALPLPRRMWAGGDLVFHGAFAVGDIVEKASTIEDIAFKAGSTGGLAFVTVRHRYAVAGRLVLDEHQDIVYRDAPDPGAAAPPRGRPEPMGEPVAAWDVPTDPVLLFRYSALTFNGHRIHYDHSYATQVEGYAGLVVHGPLQATLMLNLATGLLGALPARFSYRGRAPLVCGTPVRVEATRAAAGFDLRVRSGDVVTMTATAAAHGSGTV